ncbi:MAG TPA: ABC transporter permease [Gemmatimonadaceae bacterium]|nr:ABC transporter permease [Gemmatimonadaceae bacterium]
MTETMAFVVDMLVHATPLVITGLAVALAFRAGVWNIGADGQFIAGATAAAWVGVSAPAGIGWLALIIALIAGVIAGAIWAAIAAWLRSRFGVLEVISTIMLNFIAAYGASFLVRGPLQEPTHVYPQTSGIVSGAHMPILLGGTRLHWGFVIAIALAVIAWWVMKYSAMGFRVRASGVNPFAARSAGLIDVSRVTAIAFVTSGAIAGMAGAIEVSGVTFALYENISPGYGYTAIAVALLAGLNPLGVIGTGILFGALETAAGAMQRNIGIPSTTASVIEAIVILAVIAIAQLRADRVTTSA